MNKAGIGNITISLMYYMGLLTMKGFSGPHVYLGIPNRIARKIIDEKILSGE